VDPTSTFCAGTPVGPNWEGDFKAAFDSSPPTQPPCYLQVTSFAFRAWNRGLAATAQPTILSTDLDGGSVAFGVWLYNGTDWFPDPTFPGSTVCPGGTVLWAGKLDYWLIGNKFVNGAPAPTTTLCRFDGVNLQWEPLSLPAATLARLPVNESGTQPVTEGGITSGACYAWNDCWFFGTDGIEVHWDGQSLSDVSPGLGGAPWLDGDFTGAVAGTDPSGQLFGLAVGKSSMTTSSGPDLTAVPGAPDGSPPAQLYASQDSPFEPEPYSPTADPQLGDRFTTDLTQVSADAQGDVWVAGEPAPRLFNADGLRVNVPAPLLRLTGSGSPASCAGYDAAGSGANTFAFGNSNAPQYKWTGLSIFPDGSALASAQYQSSLQFVNQTVGPLRDNEPALTHATCGQSQTPAPSEFRRPDPVNPGSTTIPADYGGMAMAVAASAFNDAWAATSDGIWPWGQPGGGGQGALAPHLYLWTDGEQPDAPAGDDNETRPSLFTLGPPVFQVGAPTIVVTPGPVTTTTTTTRTKKVKLAPAIYAIHSRLVATRNGTYTLYLTFKVRRKVRIGVEALKGKKVVASSGVKRFTGHSGQLALQLNRSAWPTGLKWITPKA
jgi:hypothetical protein